MLPNLPILPQIIDSNILLIGPPASGKTTLGNKLSKEHRLKFYDTDAMMAENFEASAQDLMLKHGNEKFRELEYQVLEPLKRVERAIISIGGGARTYLPSYELIKTLGFCIYLQVEPEILLERLLERSKFPTFLDASNPEASLNALLETRTPLYESLAQRTYLAKTCR